MTNGKYETPWSWLVISAFIYDQETMRKYLIVSCYDLHDFGSVGVELAGLWQH